MVLEVATLNVIPGKTGEFEASFKIAMGIISSMNGFLGLKLQRCYENSNRYILLVKWDTLEDHITGFRGSPEYQDWKKWLHQYYLPFPVVEHYSLVEEIPKKNQQ